MLKLKINEKGLTLIELLVVIVLASVIMIAATSIYIQTMNNNERILQETRLREEADYLMSMLVKEFYTLKKSDVITDMTTTPDSKIITYKTAYKSEYAASSLNQCNLDSCEVVSGFKEEAGIFKLFIKGKEVKPMYNDIFIDSTSSITVPSDTSYTNQSPSYIVELTLVNTKKKENNSITFKNELSLINY